MKLDYHMHFEYGSYDKEWVEGFFKSAAARGLSEIGISEHSHTFPEFKELYYKDLVLDDSSLGKFQKKWLATNKFKYTLKDYFDFMGELQKDGKPVKIGIEVCNFQDQDEVKSILKDYPFDYKIASVHFIDGWGYDASAVIEEWDKRDLKDIYEGYTQEVEKLAAADFYNILGHPFNIRLFKCFPNFEVKPYLERVCRALAKSKMAVDVNTGTLYRYPVKEISPYPEFLAMAKDYGIPIITSSDAHKPEDCGCHINDAVAYAKSMGYETSMRFDKGMGTAVKLG